MDDVDSPRRHAYGPRVRLLESSFLSTALARLSAEATSRLEVLALLRLVNRALVGEAAARWLPSIDAAIPTRMAAQHGDRGHWRGAVLDPATRAVVVDVIRGGIVPAQLCFEMLTLVLPPQNVRLDHITLSRETDAAGQVTGAHLSAGKVGGTVAGAWLFLPDPMGATGATVTRALELYREHHGEPAGVICLPTIATPEYLRAVLDFDARVFVATARVDRGLSPADVLAALPGEHWARERGLDGHGYIVPGAGGMGEILNNAWC